MKTSIQLTLYQLVDDIRNDDDFNPPENWEEGEISYVLSQSAVRITNLENTCKEARKTLLECEALVKEYPLVHQWVLQSLEQLKEFRP